MLLSRLTLGRCELALLALTATAARAQAPGPSGTAGSNVSNVSGRLGTRLSEQADTHGLCSNRGSVGSAGL